MNKKELKAEMARHGDTGSVLAEVLGCTQQTLSRKMNDDKAEFTQREINLIRERYSLSYDRLGAIFFDNLVS